LINVYYKETKDEIAKLYKEDAIENLAEMRD
jgi:hypothetical protein